MTESFQAMKQGIAFTLGECAPLRKREITALFTVTVKNGQTCVHVFMILSFIFLIDNLIPFVYETSLFLFWQDSFRAPG